MSTLYSLFLLSVIAAVSMFAAQPKASATVGFISGVAHWPARVIRWVGVGEVLDAPSQRVADTIIAMASVHLWAPAIGLVLAVAFVAVVLAIAREAKAALWIRWALGFGAALLFPFWSASVTGLHIARGAQVLDGRRVAASGTAAAVPDLMLGLEPWGEIAPARVSQRLARFSSTLPMWETGQDPELSSLNRTIAKDFRRMWEVTDRREPNLTFALALTELSWRIWAGHLSEVAVQGRGGDPSQPWREVTVSGPAKSPVTIRTNWLPPDPLARPLIFQPSGTSAAHRTFASAVQAVDDEATRRLLEEFDKPPLNKLPLDDRLVETWYAIAPSFAVDRVLIQEKLGLTVPGDDAYGGLVVSIHNSDSSYRGAVGARVDRAGLGLYIRERNEMHVNADEHSFTRVDVTNALHGLAAEWQSVTGKAKSETKAPEALDIPEGLKLTLDHVDASPGLAIMLSRLRPTQGLDDAYPHEVGHWVFNLATATLPGDATALPQCLHEGAALVLEQASNVATRQTLGTVFKGRVDFNGLVNRNWRTIWSNQSDDIRRTPRELLLLGDEDFGREVTRAPEMAYADCWFVTELFGSELFKEARKRNKSPREVLASGWAPELDDSWATIRVVLNRKSSPLAH